MKRNTTDQLRATLEKKSKQLYPQSPTLQKRWVETSYNLYKSGRHALLTGGWRREGL
jgi:hypothetical protein